LRIGAGLSDRLVEELYHGHADDRIIRGVSAKLSQRKDRDLRRRSRRLPKRIDQEIAHARSFGALAEAGTEKAARLFDAPFEGEWVRSHVLALDDFL